MKLFRIFGYKICKLPFFIGLRDPLLPGHPKVHLKCMDPDDMDAACAGAQTIVRLIALEQARLVFGLGRKQQTIHHEDFDVATAPNDDGLRHG